ncbi:hypothetical protein [Granulicella tundricola]|uniref:Uncharacterized protein n=1 Tax=Granulicella tundricola (strain ATCC BAA-1859 / DSM 23138 / MP5ACTX9) TaxID=1198114 RepID=E8X5K5_GRATM|nr:hypothetical protein [Granulicella tundricola]ADW70632.1 hypothetical protein AciX9_3629 [Granulicella tundricola MP5ACTX9]
MDARNLHFLLAVCVFSAALLAIAGYYLIRTRRVSHSTWEDLLDELAFVNRNNIALIAHDLIDDPNDPTRPTDGRELDPSQVWTLIGGMDGLEILQENCEVLIKLASYLQQFYPEAIVVAEQLRLNARELEWHIGRLKGAAQVDKLESVFPDYAQRAVTTYYKMTRSLITLYQQLDQSRLAALESAL